MSRDGHLFAANGLVANAWVVWVHDIVIFVEVPPKFTVEKECRLEATV